MMSDLDNECYKSVAILIGDNDLAKAIYFSTECNGAHWATTKHKFLGNRTAVECVEVAPDLLRDALMSMP